MSVKIMGRVWELDLPHAHKLVLLSLADHADHDGENIYPGVGLTAWKCGYSTRQTQRIIDDLCTRGILVEVQADPGKKIVYRIDLSRAPVKQPYNPRQNVTPPPRQNVRGDKMSGVTFTTQTHDIYDRGPMTFAHEDDALFEAAQSPKPPLSVCTNRPMEPSGNGGGDTPPRARPSSPPAATSEPAEPDPLPQALCDLIGRVAIPAQKQSPAFWSLLAAIRVRNGGVEEVRRFAGWWSSDSNFIARRAKQDNRALGPPTLQQVERHWGEATRPSAPPPPPKREETEAERDVRIFRLYHGGKSREEWDRMSDDERSHSQQVPHANYRISA